MKQGTIIDVTLLAAPSSIKNKGKTKSFDESSQQGHSI